ncbi:MAG: SCP2 sterol-binding domain-containing protein [Lachnospiraceae bacterium]|nr:SCP2 sterol-binding domain-containing protein [Lachnospiraceae bacterium]
MKINIYYGGRGLIGDPTQYVIRKMQNVFEELNVTVERYDLYDIKNAITTLPRTLKEADGIVLATTVEWYGIGGYMQQFLDACWLYGDKEAISKIYMCPVCMSTTYGEREGKMNLATAWEILGGKPCSGICGYIPEISMLECREDYDRIIEKKAENMYRSISQKLASFPASNQAVKQKISMTQNVDLTPQETEQLSMYAADEEYVAQQKEDIKELSSIFYNKLENQEVDNDDKYIADFKRAFAPQPGINAIYKIKFKNFKKDLIIKIANGKMDIFYGVNEYCDVRLEMNPEIMDQIIAGDNNFQRMFMSGKMTSKGDFGLLRALDNLFPFLER